MIGLGGKKETGRKTKKFWWWWWDTWIFAVFGWLWLGGALKQRDRDLEETGWDREMYQSWASTGRKDRVACSTELDRVAERRVFCGLRPIILLMKN